MEEKHKCKKYELFNDSLYKFPQPQDMVWGVRCKECKMKKVTYFDKKTAINFRNALNK
jgi:hypothetical protein